MTKNALAANKAEEGRRLNEKKQGRTSEQIKKRHGRVGIIISRGERECFLGGAERYRSRAASSKPARRAFIMRRRRFTSLAA